MTTTVIFDITNNNEFYSSGSSILVGQTATLPFDLPVGSLVDFKATVGPSANVGSFSEQASVYTYDSSTNVVGSLLGTSAQIASSGISLTDFSINLNQVASGQIAIVISTNGTDSQSLTVGRSYTADYPGGTMIQSNNGGASYVLLAAYDFGTLSVTPAISAVPEPSSAALMGTVLVVGAAIVAIRSKFAPKSSTHVLAA